MTARPAVVIVGSGQAGFQTAASLRDLGFDGRIALVGEEPALPYQRPPLSKVYLTATPPPAVLLRPETFYAAQQIELLAGERAVAIDRARRRLRLASGSELPYDQLVLATGARPRTLEVPGAELEGVTTLRSWADADALKTQLARSREVVVVGAGFIGLEVACAALELGAAVQIVELGRSPMGRLVSNEVSTYFADTHNKRGIGFRFSDSVVEITGNGGRVSTVLTREGQQLPADTVVIGIGVVPNVELASEAGLAVDNGIAVDEQLCTADPAISAIGDCASFPSRFAGGERIRLESVQNAVDQGRSVAARIAGRPAPYRAVPWFWSDQGPVHLQIAGLGVGHDIAVLRGEPQSGSFSVFCFRGSTLRAIESVNQPREHMLGRRLLAGELELNPAQVADPDFALPKLARG